MVKILFVINFLFIIVCLNAQDSLNNSNVSVRASCLDLVKPRTIHVGNLIFSYEQFNSLRIPVSLKKKNFIRNFYSYDRYIRGKYHVVSLRHCNIAFEINGIIYNELSDDFYKDFDLTKENMIKSITYTTKSKFEGKLPFCKVGVLSIILNDSVDIESYKWQSITPDGIEL